MTNAERALEFVEAGNIVGLGTGRAASGFVRALAARVSAGLRVTGVPTSNASAALAEEVGIPLVALDDVEAVDVTVDGADEVDPQLNLIKGCGGALLREKIVATASRRLIILIGPEKLVPVLGARGVLPVEVVPFGLIFCQTRLRDVGLSSTPRKDGGRLYTTDNGNHILSCAVSAIPDPRALDERIRAIPGVVGTGLFVGMADAVLIQRGQEVEIKTRDPGRGARDSRTKD